VGHLPQVLIGVVSSIRVEVRQIRNVAQVLISGAVLVVPAALIITQGSTVVSNEPMLEHWFA
jgi:hypothetical protein